jgi:hypothetical protein
MRNSIKILFVLCFAFFNTDAQNFESKAKIDAVKKEAYYKIKLNSSITAHTQTLFADLRIFDSDGLEVPYMLKKDELNSASSSFKTFDFTQIKNDNGVQIITIQNPNNIELNNLELRMANADANRLVKISGSNNNVDWYVVKDKFYFTTTGKDNASEIFRLLEFPTTTYAFYKIEIKNKNESPLFIKSIGLSKASTVENNLQLVNEFKYTIKDSSDKNTYIYCACSPSNYIDKLEFDIASPEMYLRKCSVYRKYKEDWPDDSYVSTSVASKEVYRNIAEHLDWTFDMMSDQKGTVYCGNNMGNEKCDSFTIVIANNDNAPLKINKITARQLSAYAVAKLEPSKTYYAYFGDSTIEVPKYDLVYFQDKITKDPEIIATGPVIDKALKTKDEYNGSRDKYIVWIGLAIISIILIYLTSNMMKKIGGD